MKLVLNPSINSGQAHRLQSRPTTMELSKKCFDYPIFFGIKKDLFFLYGVIDNQLITNDINKCYLL